MRPFVILFLANLSVASFADTVCDHEKNFVKDKLIKELESGLPATLAILAEVSGKVSLMQRFSTRKDLWQGGFVLESDTRKTHCKDEKTFNVEVCKLLDIDLKQALSKEGNVSRIFLVLNPNSKEKTELMTNWAQKNAGVYRNMGFRLRWDNLSEVNKSEKILFERAYK